MRPGKTGTRARTASRRPAREAGASLMAGAPAYLDLTTDLVFDGDLTRDAPTLYPDILEEVPVHLRSFSSSPVGAAADRRAGAVTGPAGPATPGGSCGASRSRKSRGTARSPRRMRGCGPPTPALVRSSFGQPASTYSARHHSILSLAARCLARPTAPRVLRGQARLPRPRRPHILTTRVRRSSVWSRLLRSISRRFSATFRRTAEPPRPGARRQSTD